MGDNEKIVSDPIELENKDRIEKLEKENGELKDSYNKLYEYVRNMNTSSIKETNNNKTKPFNELFMEGK